MKLNIFYWQNKKRQLIQYMKKIFLKIFNIFNIFENKKIYDKKIYSIQELNQLRQREKEIQLARKARQYFSDINKKQRIWAEKNNIKSRKVS